MKFFSNIDKKTKILWLINCIAFLTGAFGFVFVATIIIWGLNIQSMPTMSKYSLFCWVAAQMAQLFGFYLVMRVHFIAKKKDSQVEKIAKPILELLVWVIGLTLYCLPAALHVTGIF